VRDNSSLMVMTDLLTALDALKEAFPGRDMTQEQLGKDVIRSFIGQYGIRRDELLAMGLTFNHTVSSAREQLEKKLQSKAA
jgi:hypothetical protein